MNIKVGQYFRDGFNNICQITKIEEDIITISGKDVKYTVSAFKDIWDKYERKNTPQELIEVGDLVELIYPHNNKKYIAIVDEISDRFVNTSNGSVRYNKIIKILTPNSNGGYDLQWEAE